MGLPILASTARMISRLITLALLLVAKPSKTISFEFVPRTCTSCFRFINSKPTSALVLGSSPRDSEHEWTRRQMFRIARNQIIAATTATIASTFLPLPAMARDDALFRKNPLTNSFLEQVRIWEQAEADEFKYGGELERGEAEKLIQRGGASSDAKKNYYSRLLVPILEIADELQQLNQLVQQTAFPSTNELVPGNAPASPTFLLQQAKEILSQSKYDSIEFKKVFNAFGDNIYYTDPDRANLYLGGGATPKSTQSLAYLLRNDILTNVQDMRAELDYLLQSSSLQNGTGGGDKGTSVTATTEDLVQMASAAQGAMTQYLNEVVPPNEIEQARLLMNTPPQ